MKEQIRWVEILAFQLLKESDQPQRVCWLAGQFVYNHPHVKCVYEPFNPEVSFVQCAVEACAHAPKDRYSRSVLAQVSSYRAWKPSVGHWLGAR